ncbi:MAG TPA: asparagine synthetase B family protein [Vicinamibacterales bacterium]|jgi:asparagine synthase (glutamine-hydrolysing)
MSGVAAVVSFDRDPGSASLAESMAAASAHRAPDGTAIWHDEFAALALLRQALFDGAPARPVTDGRRALVFDGRLDNREDLLGRLALDSAGGDLDDGALALRVLASFGDPGVEALEGDFAFVLWDAVEQRLVAGRDRIGCRPLHWSVAAARVYAATDIAQIIAARGLPPPDETAVADFLAEAPPADDRTFFRDIHRVPPAHLLIVQNGAAPVLRRYWAPDPSSSLRVRSDDDWAAECRALIERAIRARMRARGRVAVFFSGGVDSSVVLTVAHAIARRERRAPPVPVSLAYDRAESDETTYRRVIAAHVGTEPITVQAAPMDGGAFRAQAARRCLLPDLPADFSGLPAYAAAKSAGASVALTGVGPDALFAGSPFVYADLIARGRIVAALSRYWTDRTVESSGWSPTGLLSAGVWPLLPRGIRRLLRSPARRAAGIRSDPWLRLRPTHRPLTPNPPAGASFASWEILCSFQDGWAEYFLEAGERAAADAQFDDRHPLMDAAIVRFALSLPDDQRRRGRISKFVLRRAVPELAPIVAARTTKADFGHLLAAALRSMGGRALFERSAIANAGWIDPVPLARRYDRIADVPLHNDAEGRDLILLWKVAAVELWYRAVYATAMEAV